MQLNLTFEQEIALDLYILDGLLTGRDPRAGRGNFECFTPDVNEFVEGPREFYLSDGGYSRIMFNLESGRLFLTSDSRPEVVYRWPATITVRERIERRIKQELRTQGFYGPK